MYKTSNHIKPTKTHQKSSKVSASGTLGPWDPLGPPLGSSRDGWQRCCRDTLPHRLEVGVGRVELHPSLEAIGEPWGTLAASCQSIGVAWKPFHGGDFWMGFSMRSGLPHLYY